MGSSPSKGTVDLSSLSDITRRADQPIWTLPKKARLPVDRERIAPVLEALWNLPLPSYLNVRDVLSILENSSYIKIEDSPKPILRQGDHGNAALFVVLSGHMSVWSSITPNHENDVTATRNDVTAGEDDIIEMAQLGCGAFFGELSLLFGLACTAHVDALPGSELIVIPQMLFPEKAFFANEEQKRKALLLWTKARRYLDCTRSFAPQDGELERLNLPNEQSSIFHFIKQIPFFEQWSEEALTTICTHLNLVLFPAESFLLQAGHKGTELCILLSGIVHLVDPSNRVLGQLQTFGGEQGIALGEEGFVLQTTRDLSANSRTMS